MRQLTLVASDVAPVGGMERVAYELCTRLLARGWAVTVIARSCALPAQDGLRFVRLWAPSRPVSAALVLSFLHGTVRLRRHRAGLVQTNNPVVANRVDVINAHFCERAYRRSVGAPRARRQDPLLRLNSWLATGFDLMAEGWCYRRGRVRRVACGSRGVTREIATSYPAVAAATVTIPNGVDRSHFTPDEAERARGRAALGVGDGDPVAVFVGGDWHRKGLRHAIEGIAAAPGWRLVVVGAGDRAGFAHLARAAGAGDRVTFTGPLADPRPWYRTADALLQPSGYEAFSLVTLEAAASGLALVVTRINGTEELVEDGRNGWFVEADGHAIGERLRRLSADPASLTAARAAARASSAAFDWDAITDRYEALYAELTGASGGGR